VATWEHCFWNGSHFGLVDPCAVVWVANVACVRILDVLQSLNFKGSGSSRMYRKIFVIIDTKSHGHCIVVIAVVNACVCLCVRVHMYCDERVQYSSHMHAHTPLVWSACVLIASCAALTDVLDRRTRPYRAPPTTVQILTQGFQQHQQHHTMASQTQQQQIMNIQQHQQLQLQHQVLPHLVPSTLLQQPQQRKRKERRTCNCKNSRCLKLYVNSSPVCVSSYVSRAYGLSDVRILKLLSAC